MTEPELYPSEALRGIIEVLTRRKVRYVVIGGVGAILQGVLLPRTADVDITPASDTTNKARLARALRDLDAMLRAPGLEAPISIPLDERTFTGMVTMTFETRFGPFDISFVPDGTDGYEDLKENARFVERFGVQIPVAAVRDIARSKRAAGREKDAAHLQILLDFMEEEADG